MSQYKPYPKYKDSGVEWLGQVPEHWGVKPVYAIASLRNGYPFKADFFTSEGAPGKRVIRIRDLSGDSEIIYSNEDCPPWAEIKDGDILLGMDGDFNIHRWSRGNAQLNQRVCTVSGNSESLNLLLSQSLSIPLKIINDLAYSTTVKHLSSYEVLHAKIPIPPDDELEIINNILAHDAAHIDVLISKQQRLIELLQEKRLALISHVVTKGLNPDAPMKDSGVEWLGHVAKHWIIARLKFVSTVQTGIAKGKDYQGRSTREIPYLRVANVQNGFLVLDDVATLDIANEELPRYLLRPGDVLMNEGGDFDKLGRGAIWRGEISPCIHQNHVFAVRPQNISSEWLNFYTGSNFAQFYFMSRSKQSTNLASISSTNIMELPVAVPPMPEQRAITAYLDHETVKIDTLITKAQRAISLAQEHRVALISAAVTGKICVTGTQNKAQTLSKSREYFQKVVLAAEVTSQLHKEPSFGRVKLQKILYLSEYHAQLPFQRSEYQRYAAGPHDPKALYAIEGQMKKQKWFDSKPREGGYGKMYVPMERYNAYQQYYERYFADAHGKIHRIIDLLRHEKTQFCEVVATLYGVWNDFLLQGRSPSEPEIIEDARTNWDPKKQEIPEKLWSAALQWMKKHDLIPVGWGEPTIHRGEL